MLWGAFQEKAGSRRGNTQTVSYLMIKSATGERRWTKKSRQQMGLSSDWRPGEGDRHSQMWIMTKSRSESKGPRATKVAASQETEPGAAALREPRQTRELWGRWDSVIRKVSGTGTVGHREQLEPILPSSGKPLDSREEGSWGLPWQLCGEQLVREGRQCGGRESR